MKMVDPVEANSLDAQISRLIERTDKAIAAEDFGLAAALISEAVVLDPENSNALRKLYGTAGTCFAENQFEKALLLYNLLRLIGDVNTTDEFPEILDEYPYLLFDTGLTLIELGIADRGEALLRDAIRWYEVSGYFLRTLGYFLLNEGRYEEGIEYLTKANDLDDQPDELVPSLEAIAWAYTKLGRKEEALNIFLEQYVNWLNHDILDLYLRFVHLLGDETAIPALQKLQDELVKMEEEDLWIEGDDVYFITAILDQAERYQRAGQQAEAFERFLYLKGKYPDDARILRGLGRWFIAFKLPELAVDMSERALRLEPNNPANFALHAAALNGVKNYSDALQAAEQGLKLAFPDRPKSVQEQPDSYATAKVTVPHLDDFDNEIPQVEPDPRAALLVAQADALSSLGQFEKALRTIKQAQVLFPNEQIFYRYAATLFLKLGKPRQSQKQIMAARKKGVTLDQPLLELERKIKDEAKKA